jgi:integrase
VRDAAGLGWLVPQHLRKSALTAIENPFDMQSAADFAGHSDVRVTEDYVATLAKEPQDLRSAFTTLDELAAKRAEKVRPVNVSAG